MRLIASRNGVPAFADTAAAIAQLDLVISVDTADAEPIMRRALNIDEENFGSEHPNVARHLNNLAQLLQATNRPAWMDPLGVENMGEVG